MKKADSSPYQYCGQTHPGMSGKNNEDSFEVGAYTLLEGEKSYPVLLAVLSDGIGGHQAGEVASKIAVEYITKTIIESDLVVPGHVPSVIENGITGASDAIYQSSQEDNARRGMGGTIAIVLIINQHIFTASVGDSRIYLIREGTIRQISIDHTWIQEALEYGLITPDMVKGHPNAHVIRRYLGGQKPPEVDFRMRLSGKETDAEAIANQGQTLQSDDLLMLCSDGLTDLVNNDEILTAFKDHATMEETLDFLIKLANERGGHDNITIVAVKVPKPEKVKISSQDQTVIVPRSRKKWLWGCLGVMVLAVALVGMGFLAWLNPDTRGVMEQNVPFLGTFAPATQTLTPSETPLPSVTPTNTLEPSLTPTSTATKTPIPTETMMPTDEVSTPSIEATDTSGMEVNNSKATLLSMTNIDGTQTSSPTPPATLPPI